MIDAHVHVWDRARNPQPWIDPVTMAVLDQDFGARELTAMLAATGAGAAVLVQSSNALAETEDLLALAADAPVAAVVGWVDLTGDVAAQVEHLRSLPGGALLRGIRHLAHLEADAGWLARDDVARGLDALDGLAVDLVVRAHQLPLAAQVVRRHPGVRFVLDHLGNPEAEAVDAWRRDLAALAVEPNVVAKLSGLVSWLPAAAIPPLVETALDAFGPARLLYGSDWPLAELADGGAVGWAEQVRGVADRLSTNERTALLGGTAAMAYGVAA